MPSQTKGSQPLTNRVTAAEAVAPFTGFLAARAAAELLPLIDAASPHTSPFGEITRSMVIPALWIYFISTVFITLARYTYHYYRQPTADAIEEKVPCGTDPAESRLLNRINAVLHKLGTIAQLTLPAFAVVNLASLFYIPVLVIMLPLRRVEVGPWILTNIFIAGGTFLISYMVTSAASFTLKEDLRQARAALSRSPRAEPPPRGSYLLCDETSDGAGQRIDIDFGRNTYGQQSAPQIR